MLEKQVSIFKQWFLCSESSERAQKVVATLNWLKIGWYIANVTSTLFWRRFTKVDSALAQKEVDTDDVDFTCNFNVGSMLKYSC